MCERDTVALEVNHSCHGNSLGVIASLYSVAKSMYASFLSFAIAPRWSSSSERWSRRLSN